MRDKTTINRLKMYKSGGKAIRCDNNCDFNGQSSYMVQIHPHLPVCFTHFLIVVGVGGLSFHNRDMWPDRFFLEQRIFTGANVLNSLSMVIHQSIETWPQAEIFTSILFMLTSVDCSKFDAKFNFATTMIVEQ